MILHIKIKVVFNVSYEFVFAYTKFPILETCITKLVQT